MANVAKPLNFCGKAAMEIAGDILEHWAIGTVGDTAVGMIATYVSERFDGKTPQEAFQSTMSSADDIILNAVITSAVGTGLDSVTAPKCFVAGTMVTTAAGLVAIENISIGDQVLAQNPETGEIGYKEVLDTFRNETNVVVHVTVNDETFTCTEEHPFYVEGKGWVNASALRAGMVVWLADGTKAIIEDVTIEYLDTPIAVYNFKVEDFHTYFIGYTGVLVHNANCGVQTTVESEKETLYRGDRSTVAPDDVFESGFASKGTGSDLLAHTSSNTTPGDFVSTSQSKDVAQSFAGRNGYVYEISTNRGINVAEALGDAYAYPEQLEVAIPGGILGSEVVGAYPLSKGQLTGEFIPNPNYGG